MRALVVGRVVVEQRALRAVQLDRPGLLHRVDDDPDEQVEDQKRRDQDVGDVEQQRPVRELLAALDVDGEVLERQQHEHRHHRLADVLEVGGVVVVEDDPADHPVDVDEQQGDRGQARDARDRPADRDGQHAQVRQQPNRAHDAQQSHQPQQRGVLADARHEARRDDDEVEDVPAAADELARAVGEGGHAQGELDHEEPEDDPVGKAQLAPDRGVDRLVGLEAERHGVDRDDREHQRVEPRRLDYPPAGRRESGAARHAARPSGSARSDSATVAASTVTMTPSDSQIGGCHTSISSIFVPMKARISARPWAR